MTNFMAKTRVVLNSIVTWAGVAIMAITVIMAELRTADWFPEDTAGTLIQWGTVAIGALTSVISVIKRVTPVPPEGMQVVVEDEAAPIVADVHRGWF